MGILEASRTVEINADKSTCYAIISDLPKTPEWQESMISIDVLETHSDGLASLVEIRSDGKVKEITSRISFEYQPEDGMTWEQQKGDLKWLKGSWALEELGSGLTKATYALKADTGRMLGLLVKGPVQDKLKEWLTKDAAEGLKARAES
ncbi:MAG: SRPBCC family protein [Solirubrobacterales bacterium]|jgi:ribosome-associated toxin RatA of RatAB toxin-antitoxin module|nr:SRPBCC family protein [Solirubrobacterales bacterium]